MFPSETVFNQSIWGDEGFSAILSMKSLPDILKTIATDTSPPLWNITEWIVFNTLGTDERYIRSLAFLFFALSIFFVYKIGTLLWTRKTGAIAALLTFFNPFFFIYAFEGRMYSILALGVTASMYFFLKIYYRSGEITKLTKAGYVISTIWALYSHHFAIFALFIQGLWWLKEIIFGKRVTSKKVFKLFVAIGIGYLPWMIPLYNQAKMVGGGFWLGTPTVEDLRNLIYEYLAEGTKNPNLKVPILNLALHQVSLYLVFALLVIRKWHQSIKKTVLLLMWFLGPIVLTWLISQKFQSIFFNRYLLYSIPGAMLIVGSGRRNKLSEPIIGLLLVLFVFIDYNYFISPQKLPFRQMSEYVKETRQEGDFLINWNSSAHHLWETKYYGFDSPIYIPGGGELPFFVGTALMEETDVASVIPKGTNRVGVTTSGSIEEIDLPGYAEKERKVLKPISADKELKFVWYTKD